MKFVIGSFSFALGYVLVYYAIGLYKNYYPTDTTDADPSQDIWFPLSYLMGFPYNKQKDASLPFKLTKTASTTSATSGQQGGNILL